MIRLVNVLAATILLTGCAIDRHGSSSATSSAVHLSEGSKNRVLDHLNATFPNPGPFGLQEIKNKDGTTEEVLVARGEPGKYGGSLSVASFGTGPRTFNFWTAGDVESGGIGYIMFEKLVDIDAWTGKPYPRLARTIELSPDKQTYTIKMRKRLLWSDGTPLTADDVVFTFSTLVGEQYGQHASSLHDTLSIAGRFPTIKKLDQFTIEIHTPLPFAPFLTELSYLPIAPKHIMEPVVKKGRQAFESFWNSNCNPRDIVVSGRFKLDRYLPGQRLEFVRNPSYSMVDKLGRRLPYLDRFNYAIVPDQNTMILKFYGGEIDLLDIRSIRGQDAALMKQREKIGNFSMYNLGPDDGTMFFVLNMCRRINPETSRPYIDPIKQKWFNNVYFRQAINHAIDRERMVANILRGVGKPLFTAESTASLYHNENLRPFGQDIALAANLLAKGGFVKRQGVLYDANNHPIEFTLLTNAGNNVREAASIMIVNDLKRLGMKVNFQAVDFNTLINKVETSLDWEAVVMGLTGSKLEPYDGANVWKSDGRLHMFDQRRPDRSGAVHVADARGWERKVDQLFDLGATTFDEQKRKEYFDLYQQIVYDQVPFIYLYSTIDLTAMKNRFGNYKPTPLGIAYTPLGSMHNLEEIYYK